MRKSGFTLVEMLTVLLILAVLAAAVTAGLSTAREKAWRTQARETCRNICEAWTIYLSDARKFPDDIPSRGQKLEAKYDNMKWIVNASENDFKRVYLEISDEEKDDGLRDHWTDPKTRKRQMLHFSLDTDYDGQVDNPYQDPDAEGSALAMAKIRTSAIAWSEGNPKTDNRKKPSNAVVAW